MLKAHSIAEAQAFRKKNSQLSLGFVPTMGFLHEGHLSLVRRSKAENDLTAVSIFVNPTQFNSAEDLANYPMDLERDLEMLKSVGVDLVFLPNRPMMYPSGFDTKVVVGELACKLEGAFRPGHFDGVTQVVAKLFNIVGPDRAYFGLKDYQQLKVIERMTEDLNFPIEIHPCPIARETSGLAMSSRNARLTEQQREQANSLYHSLQLAKAEAKPGEPVDVVEARMRAVLESSTLAEVEYIGFNDGETLEPLTHFRGKVLVSLAVFFGPVRLIDNHLLEF